MHLICLLFNIQFTSTNLKQISYTSNKETSKKSGQIDILPYVQHMHYVTIAGDVHFIQSFFGKLQFINSNEIMN